MAVACRHPYATTNLCHGRGKSKGWLAFGGSCSGFFRGPVGTSGGGVGDSKEQNAIKEVEANKTATRNIRKKTVETKFNARISYINMQGGRKRAR